MSRHPPALILRLAALIALGLGSTAASAQPIADAGEPGSEPRVTRLTPEEKAALLDAGTEDKAERALAQAMGGGADRSVHGEIGAMIGTGGARGVFGTAVIPLGKSGTAIVSFENYRFGDSR